MVTALALVASSTTSSRASATSTHGYPYAVGAPILALKLTRMQMLTSSVGVGVAPITTYSGGLVQAYLVRTNDAGATWSVAGDLPKGFYPWTTAFSSTDEGYVINGGAALFTDDAGRTWSHVTITGGPLAVSVNGAVVWIEVERCPHGAMNARCYTYLDAFAMGRLSPSSVTKVPTDQPVITQVGPSSGYAIGNDGVMTHPYVTSNSGTTWRVVKSPCARHESPDGFVASTTMLLAYCTNDVSTSAATTTLFTTNDAGATWQKKFPVGQTGVGAVVGTTGQFLWSLNDGTFAESSDAGRTWVTRSNVKYGTNGEIVSFGAHEAWHVLTGQGIYRTLNGTSWTLLR